MATQIADKIGAALRRQGVKAGDLTDAQRDRATRALDEGLAGKEAVAWILADPDPQPLNAEPEGNGNGRTARDPEAAALLSRVYAFSGVSKGSNIHLKDVRRFLDEVTVDAGDQDVTVLRDGRNAVLPRRDVVDFATGEMPRKDRKAVAAALAEINHDGAFHWDRALATMVALQFAEEA